MRIEKYLLIIIVITGALMPQRGYAEIDRGQLGAWYMYFWNYEFEDSPWGIEGDFQHRNWGIVDDFEQRIIRGGVTYKPVGWDLKFTLGYAHFLTGDFGASDETTGENRIYQQMVYPHKVGGRFYLLHRFRYEQRDVDEQDFRTRFRYNLFLNIPLNSTKIEAGTVYLALYNEIFLNGQKNIGKGKSVDIFDRDWAYGGLGYAFSKQFKVQFGYMHEIANTFDKGQLQFSIHHKF